VKTILIVDDNATMRDLLRLHLTAAGHVVSVAEDAAAAEAALQRVVPDLIITDVYMGAVDGFALVESMRKKPALAGVPVVFLTVDENGYDRAKALGAVDYLRKPIRVEELLGVVAKHLA